MKNKTITIHQLKLLMARKKMSPSQIKFKSTYEKLISGQTLSVEEENLLTKIIACFMVAGDKTIHKLAYSMALKYGQYSGNYDAAIDIATQLRYYPVVQLINTSTHVRHNHQDSMSSLLNDALAEVYRKDYYRSEQQYLLDQIISHKKNVTAIAPTSYGKSDMLLKKALAYYSSGKKVCILTPTKSLLSQTLSAIIKLKNDRRNVIVYPDVTYDKAGPLIAIFTQERFAAFLSHNPKEYFDYLFVDEAHNIMEADERGVTLSRDLIIAQTRNQNLNIDFFSPFIISPDKSLEVIQPFSNIVQSNKTIYRIEEYMKVPKYIVWDKAKKNLITFDQFTGVKVSTKTESNNEASFIIDNSSNKNIIYANSPWQVEDFANKLAQKLPLVEFEQDEQAIIDELCNTLSESVHTSYTLINLLRHGIIISHGRMLDNIKTYTESLYRRLNGIKYVVTTSTLLEGVNLPANKLFLLNYYKGRGNLSYSSFHNLAGRVARYNHVFNLTNPDISLLTPEIYLLNGSYLNNRSHDPIDFLEKNAKEGIKAADSVKNPLLLAYKGKDAVAQKNHQATIMANVDRQNYDTYKQIATNITIAKTKVGELLYLNNVFLQNIPMKEEIIYEHCLKYKSEQYEITNGHNAINALYRIFLIPLCEGIDKTNAWIYSLYIDDYKRNIYSEVIENRINDEKIGAIIGRMVNNWKNRIGEPVYVGSMGDVNKTGSKNSQHLNYHVFLQGEIHLMPSYALGLLKENFDNLDNYILPFFEVMHTLDIVNDSFYNKIKYGTEDRNIIALIKTGLDASLAKIIADDHTLTEKLKKYNQGDEKTQREEIIVALENKKIPLMLLDIAKNII